MIPFLKYMGERPGLLVKDGLKQKHRSNSSETSMAVPIISQFMAKAGLSRSVKGHTEVASPRMSSSARRLVLVATALATICTILLRSTMGFSMP